jgi:hypothetical protein
MSVIRRLLVAAALAAVPVPLTAQQGDVEVRLAARGIPADLARQVRTIAADAASQGVPSGPLADKAIEGWAKHVPAERIVVALRQFAARMAEAGTAVRGAGLEAPSGAVIAAAAEAMGGGLGAEQIRSVVRAAPPDAAAPGLSVAAALAAQGIGGAQAVTIVVDAMHRHRPMSQLLDLPSVARAMHDQGMSPGEIGDKLMPRHGGDEAGGEGRGGKGDRPPNVPPGTGRPDNAVVHRALDR